MAKAHILEQVGDGVYDAVAHFAMPTTSNSAGVPWKTCYIASKNGQPITSRLLTTTLQGGNATNDPGKITATEAASIAAADTVELTFHFGFDVASPLSLDQQVLNAANAAIAQFQAAFVQRFA